MTALHYGLESKLSDTPFGTVIARIFTQIFSSDFLEILF